LDELVRMADELPLANAVAVNQGQARRVAPPPANEDAQAVTQDAWYAPVSSAWHAAWAAAVGELRSLVRVSRIAQPEAALLSPEQSFFVRENLKLKLLNARLGLLSRQAESARADVAVAQSLVARYFDPTARRTVVTLELLGQVQTQLKTLALPRVDESLSALSLAAGTR
jgi:uroporphyrin-3 C-methyltransferase